MAVLIKLPKFNYMGYISDSKSYREYMMIMEREMETLIEKNRMKHTKDNITNQVIEDLKKQRAEILSSTNLVATEIAKIEAQTAITRAKIRGASAKELLELEKENNTAIFKANTEALFQNLKQQDELILLERSLQKKADQALIDGNGTYQQELLNQLQEATKKRKELQREEAEGRLFQANLELQIYVKL